MSSINKAEIKIFIVNKIFSILCDTDIIPTNSRPFHDYFACNAIGLRLDEIRRKTDNVINTTVDRSVFKARRILYGEIKSILDEAREFPLKINECALRN